jgi:hypothetical protein
MNKLLRHLVIASLFLGIAGLPGAMRAQQDDGGGAPPAGGRGGRGRGNWQGGPPPDGSSPGGQHHHGPPPGAAGASPSNSGASGAKSAKTVTGHVSGEQFYIVSSVDPAKQELLLKEPKEVTLLMKVSDTTQYADDTGKGIKLADLRAGDTVWVASSGSSGEPMAMRIRKGQMTVADLHRYYLDYPQIK